jgi:hypothetical protein
MKETFCLEEFGTMCLHSSYATSLFIGFGLYMLDDVLQKKGLMMMSGNYGM